MNEMPRSDSLLNRFLRYVAVDTQSSGETGTYPSTDGQRILLELLKKELIELGLEDVAMDEYCYVTGKLPGNTSGEIPAIAFAAHVDTSPDESGTTVTPLVRKDYDGSVLFFPKNQSIALDPDKIVPLKTKMGKTIITASGDTLLGADDKCGIAEIMTAVEYLKTHSEIKHGDVWVLFTPDEEIGSGTTYFRREKFPAKFAYTLDGGGEGGIECENFNAANGTVTVTGFNTHPGAAKNKMINAVRAMGYYLSLLPDALSPERTELREGFIHPTNIAGEVNCAHCHFIIRDFTVDGLNHCKELLQNAGKMTESAFPGASVTVDIADAYKNMREIFDAHPEVVQIAFDCAERLGIKPRSEVVRGGTDGARLSFMGLPTPNLWTGGYMYHSKFEFAVLEEMVSATALIIEIAREFALGK